MHILILGGAGFLGSHITDRLIGDGNRVRIIDNFKKGQRGYIESYLNHKADLCEIDALEIEEKHLDDIDVVINAAELTGIEKAWMDPGSYFYNNVGIVNRLFDVIKDGGFQSCIERIVLLSSYAVYGEGAYWCPKCEKMAFPKREYMQSQMECRNSRCDARLNVHQTNERNPCLPSSVYGVVSKAREDVTNIISRDLGIPLVIIRAAEAYGSRQFDGDGTGGDFAWKAATGGVIKVFEDGQQIRDFVHAKDIAVAVSFACSRKNMCDQIFNVGTGCKTTILNFAELVYKIFTDEEPSETNPVITGYYRMGDARHICFDVRKIRHCGFKSRIGLLDGGLNEMKSWFEEIGISTRKEGK